MAGPVPDTRMPSNSSRQAFTLIELLVVIAIIAVLASLLLPVFQNARLKSYRSVATSNLKQVAAGILSYAGDHDGQLPGPLSLGQGPDYSTSRTDALGFYIWKYIGAAEPTATVQQANVLSNPAYERSRLKPDAPAYALHMTVTDADGVVHMPWGGGGSAGASGEPMRTVALSGMKERQGDGTVWDTPQIWALVDVDQKNAPNVAQPAPDWTPSLPKTPAHGEVRLTLFFDWHVESVKVREP